MKYGRYLMNCLHNESFKNSSNAIANLGDSIQALAIDSIYEQLGIDKKDIRYIERDFPDKYIDEPVELVFYSEFVKHSIFKRTNFSKNMNIKSFMSTVFYDDIKNLCTISPNLIEILKNIEPVGARDEKSKKILENSGIETYLTGCFTICFPKRNIIPKEKKVFFVDISKELEQYIPEELYENCEYITHAVQIDKYPVDFEENQRLDKMAFDLLERYKNEATLVVTGRLHAAVPCIAMGIPVVLAANNIDFRFEWVEKLVKPYQLGEYEEIDWNPKPVDIEPLKKKMLSYFEKALNGEDFRSELRWIDDFYSNREHIKPYKVFRTIIESVKKDINAEEFNYIIWGAGFHCGYVYEIISDIIPNAKLISVVDKYRTGEFEGVPIIRLDQIDTSVINHMFITTVPGKEEAIKWRNEKMPDLPYSIITSQHKS